MITNNRGFGKDILSVLLNITQCLKTNSNDHVNLPFRIKVSILHNLKKCDKYIRTGRAQGLTKEFRGFASTGMLEYTKIRITEMRA